LNTVSNPERLSARPYFDRTMTLYIKGIALLCICDFSIVLLIVFPGAYYGYTNLPVSFVSDYAYMSDVAPGYA
jgi:hypothetical protein